MKRKISIGTDMEEILYSAGGSVNWGAIVKTAILDQLELLSDPSTLLGVNPQGARSAAAQTRTPRRHLFIAALCKSTKRCGTSLDAHHQISGFVERVLGVHDGA